MKQMWETYKLFSSVCCWRKQREDLLLLLLLLCLFVFFTIPIRNRPQKKIAHERNRPQTKIAHERNRPQKLLSLPSSSPTSSSSSSSSSDFFFLLLPQRKPAAADPPPDLICLVLSGFRSVPALCLPAPDSGLPKDTNIAAARCDSGALGSPLRRSGARHGRGQIPRVFGSSARR
jgi:hypothetical protein